MAQPKILKDINDLQTQFSNINTYNNTSVVRTDESPVTYTVNPIPTTWTQVVEGLEYVNGDYNVKASSYSLNEAFKAFDNNESTAWTSSGANSSNIVITLPAPIALRKIKIRYTFSSGLSRIVLKASTNGSSWVTLSNLSTNSSSIGVTTEYDFSSDNYYQYYSVEATRSTAAEFSLSEFQIASYSVVPATISHTVATLPDSFVDYQRVLIKTPSNYNIVGVTTNNLNGIVVDTILYPNKYYELIYQGSKFTAREVV